MVDRTSGERSRLYLYDNLKFLLIFLVVLGHFTDGCTIDLFGTATSEPQLPQSMYLNKIFIFIYGFHMPLFMFISGLFHRRRKDEKFNGQKVLIFFVLGLTLKFLLYASRVIFQTKIDREEVGDLFFNFSGGDGTFWYLFALAAYIAICYVCRNSKPWFVLAFSVVLALFVGYDNAIGDDYSLSRIIVFFPFYYCGYLIDPKKLMELVNRWYIRIVSLIIVGIWAYFSFAKTELVYPLRMLFTGKNSYLDVETVTLMDCTFWHRLLAMAISAVLCFAFIGISVNVRIPFISTGGTRTLQIYFWHRTVIYALTYYGFQQALAQMFPNNWWIYYSLTALAVTAVLSLKIFGKPLDGIMNCVKGVDRKIIKEKGNGK